MATQKSPRPARKPSPAAEDLIEERAVKAALAEIQRAAPGFRHLATDRAATIMQSAFETTALTRGLAETGPKP